MATQKPESPEPVPAKPVATPRSEALEAELAMLEAILPPDAKSPAQPAPVDPTKDSGGPR